MRILIFSEPDPTNFLKTESDEKLQTNLIQITVTVTLFFFDEIVYIVS